METTERLLREQGYAATGLHQILEESGTSKSTLYYHFPDGKAELVAAAIREHREKLVQTLDLMQKRYPHARRGFAALFRFYCRELDESGFTKGSALATVALENPEESVQREISQGYRGMKLSFQSWLMRSGIPTRTAATQAEMTLALLEGALILSKAHRSVTPLLQALQQVARMLPPDPR